MSASRPELPTLRSDIKTRWLNALRSGHYLQGRGRLRNDTESFCVLGVLCDIIKDDPGINGEWEQLDDLSWWYKDPTGRACGVLPPHTQQLVTTDWDRQYRWSWEPLMSPNDRGVPFEQLAEMIESYC